MALALILTAFAPIVSGNDSNANGRYHWARQSSRFTLRVGDNVDGVWTKLLGWAISEWNENDTVTLKEVNGAGNPQECRSVKGRVEVCNWRYGTQDGWLGLTRLFFDKKGTHIEAATVQMNDSFFDQKNGTYNSDAARRHTICHELGHAIGLDHVSSRSCMNDSQSAVFNNLVPIKKDYTALARLYKHKDSTTTVAGKQKKDRKERDKKNRDKKKQDKDKKNKRKEARDRKRDLRRKNRQAEANSFFEATSLPAVPSGLTSDETVIEQHLDDGRKMVTFISWADDE